MRVLLGILLVMGLAQQALAQQLQIKTPEGNVEVNVNPGMGFGPAGGCQRYPTCGNCVMSVTNACGWCVQSGQCVPREDGACGDEQMAMASTQCPLPGARGPQRGGRGGVTIVMPGAPAAEPPAPAGMDDGAFQALVEAIKEEGFEASKLNVLESAAQENSSPCARPGPSWTCLDSPTGNSRRCVPCAPAWWTARTFSRSTNTSASRQTRTRPAKSWMAADQAVGWYGTRSTRALPLPRFVQRPGPVGARPQGNCSPDARTPAARPRW